MTEQEVAQFFEAALADLAAGVTDAWTSGSTRMLTTVGTPVAELEASARSAAVAAVTVWFQLRLLRDIATQEGE